MTVLVLVGLMVVCGKLWFDVGALRLRIARLELGLSPVAEPKRPAPAVTRPVARPVFRPVSRPVPQAVPPERPVPSPAPPPVATPMSAPAPRQAPKPAPAAAKPAFGFEDLFGRKLPIWAGGITLAVAGFLIVKYSIDIGLLSPAVRVGCGLLFGTGLIVAAEAALRGHAAVRDPRVRQALAGAGVATLYASVLVAANLYHLVAPLTAFVGLALTTVLAGGLSLRFGAPSAVLGLVGGLAAPALVGSGPPDVPLLSAYLALAVGGLCALSRTQRWMWLGVAALVGGFGWGVLLLFGGVLSVADTGSIGVYVLLLGVVLPVLAFGGPSGASLRIAGSLAACAQLAALVALGGFAPLEWGLFGLISAAIVWLSRREAALADLPVAGLAVALLLAAAWPHPSAAMLAPVIGGIAAIYGAPAAWRVWRGRRLADAGQVAAICIAVAALPALHLPLSDIQAAALAALGAVVAAAIAALGWRNVDRRDDARFAVLATVCAALLAAAGAIVAPAWLVAPWVAVVATALLLLAGRAADVRIERSAWALGFAALFALLLAPPEEAARALGLGHGGTVAALVRWLVPALAAALFAWRGQARDARLAAQVLAVLLGYVALAQIVPLVLLPLVPALALAALALDRRMLPALAAAAAVAGGWAALPFGLWLAGAGGAAVGLPLYVSALPSTSDALLRLALPALAAAVVAWRRAEPQVRAAGIAIAAVLGTIALHTAFKHVLAIDGYAAFVQRGLLERTVWEAALAGAGLALWQRMPRTARGLIAASLAHFAWFTGLLHNPLWAEQAVGGWPVANLLLPAYGTAFALLLWTRRIALPPLAQRARGWVQMALIALFAFSTLRHVVHGSLLVRGDVGAGEDIARSVLLIALGIGYLRYGIVHAARDWRLASLGLMLFAVGKVFLSDAAGLDGLLRIASFAALGFSLIGIGWLYARYLPEDLALTPDSRMRDMPAGGN